MRPSTFHSLTWRRGIQQSHPTFTGATSQRMHSSIMFLRLQVRRNTHGNREYVGKHFGNSCADCRFHDYDRCTAVFPNNSVNFPKDALAFVLSYQQGTLEQWRTVFFISAGMYLFTWLAYIIVVKGSVVSWAKPPEPDFSLEVHVHVHVHIF